MIECKELNSLCKHKTYEKVQKQESSNSHTEFSVTQCNSGGATERCPFNKKNKKNVMKA